MADVETDLRNRLARLADAVPVATGGLDPVHRGAVEARRAIRMAWVTPLVVLVAVVVGASLLNGGKGLFTPGASEVIGPVEATDARGPFSLTIRSTKATYREGDAIDISARLEFAGPESSVEIAHGLGANQGPLAFGVVEPVDVPGVGLIQLGGGYRLACVQSTLQHDHPITAPYAKGGSPVLDRPAGPSLEQVQDYMFDRVLRLPVGTWHVYAIAKFRTPDCEARLSESEIYDLRAEITIEVVGAPAEPSTTSEFSSDGSIEVTDRDGDFKLTMRSDKSRYLPNEPINVSASLTYLGDQERIQITHDSSGPVMFGIREKVFGEISVGSISY